MKIVSYDLTWGASSLFRTRMTKAAAAESRAVLLQWQRPVDDLFLGPRGQLTCLFANTNRTYSTRCPN